MDNKPKPSKEKVGADGLTKKQRRAQKVQARQPEEAKDEAKPIKIDTPQSVPENKEEVKEKIQPIQENITENISAAIGTDSKPLSEKEKRKLEWEKKLAEQNLSKKEELSRAEQKAKRREIQEAQRLAKAKPTQSEKPKTPTTKVEKPPQRDSKSELQNTTTTVKPQLKKVTPTVSKKFHCSRVQLLNHLYTSVDLKLSELQNSVCFHNIHPAFIQLGVQYSTKTVIGSNARCIALLYALTNLIRDLKSPGDQEFGRYLESVLQNCTDYLAKCRMLAVSMTNALRLFKLQLTQLDANSSNSEKRAKLLEFVNTYISDEILTAGKAISMKVLEKISDGDVILIYGCSSLIKCILTDAFNKQKQFRVIIVDSRPLLEGREMLRRLTQVGIDCTYILINALSYVMTKVTKVLLGAHALLTNGYVMSRTGTAQVALIAQAYNKPVLVCCETYKFSEKVQTDSLVYNEIGDPDSLLKNDLDNCSGSPLKGWKDCDKLTPLNLMYDVTPPGLVTAVVTELAILPCTSVPVVLRIKPTEI